VKDLKVGKMSELTTRLEKSVHTFTVAFEGISGYLCKNGEIEGEGEGEGEKC